MSYANVIMYGAVLPSYRKPGSQDKEEEKQDIVKADDPDNKERVRQFLEQIE